MNDLVVLDTFAKTEEIRSDQL